MMNRSTLWLHFSLSLLLLAAISLMSYFGYPNPVIVGLQSSIAVGLLLTVIVIGLYFLPHQLALAAFLLLLLLYLLLTVGNWWHFQYFQVYFNYEFMRFARDSGEAFRAFSAFNYLNEALVLLLLLLLSALLFWFWKRSKISHRLLKIQSVISLLLGLSFLYLANSNIELLRSVNALTLSPYYFHPVHAFFYSDEASPAGPDKKWLAFKKRNTVTHRQRFLPQGIQQKNYNIIVLTMESFRASFVGKYSDSKESLTPNFDRISNSGILLKNFYANTNYTVKGENAMLCGIFDHNAKISIAEYDAEKNLNCMPSILKNSGYETYYYHANYGKFYNRRQFLPQMGFSQLYFHADKFPHKSDGREYIGWGLSDAEMFSIVVDELTSRSASPFFAQVMSISNHYPFNFDWPIDVPNKMPESLMQKEMDTYLAYENAIVYSDYALGVFWDKFKQSPLYENTIVVITGDHGVWSFDETKELSDIEKNEEFFRMPLYIYHPDVKTPVVIDQIASQVDLPVTLMDLLGIDFPRETFIGKNLFDEVETPWAVMMKGGEVYVRTEDTLCMPQSPTCAGIQQSCWAETGVEDFIQNFGTSSCFNYQGDPLLNGSFVDVSNRKNLLDESFGMISYENWRIFESKSPSVVLQEPRYQGFLDLQMALQEPDANRLIE